MNLDYKEKYLKYKNKYLLTKTQQGGRLNNSLEYNDYYILFNFFAFDTLPAGATWPSDIESLLRLLSPNIKYQTDLFKSKLQYLLDIFNMIIPNHQVPKKSYQDKFGFYKYMLELLFNNPNLTVEEFKDIAKALI
jgi:hypothetical protein